MSHPVTKHGQTSVFPLQRQTLKIANGAQINEEGLQDRMVVDGLRQSCQWFNLRKMKRISSALCTAFSADQGRSTHYSVKNPVQPPLYMSNPQILFYNILEATL